MKLIDQKILLDEGKIEESILIKSFEEYKEKGGKRDMLDCYSFIKEKAKNFEGDYISLMDQSLSGIDVPHKVILDTFYAAQAFWTILSMWFNKPLRYVDYGTFNLREFNKL